MRVPAHPGLYEPSSETPTLLGTLCGSCGRVSFPAISIGCDACGAAPDVLEATDLDATGTLYSFATVHLHHGDIEAPFTIGEVELDAGPLVTATMDPEGRDLSIGQRVRAVWRVARVEENGDEVVEPVFAVSA